MAKNLTAKSAIPIAIGIRKVRKVLSLKKDAKITKRYVNSRLKFVLISVIRGENKNHFNPYNLWQKNHFKSKTTVTIKSESVLLILN